MALLSHFAFKEKPVRENFGKEGGQGQPRIQIDDTLLSLRCHHRVFIILGISVVEDTD